MKQIMSFLRQCVRSIITPTEQSTIAFTKGKFYITNYEYAKLCNHKMMEVLRPPPIS